MSTSDVDAVRRTLRTYAIVGATLFAGTLTTLMVATVPWLDVGEHGFDKYDAILGLAIALFKATLVATVFMHLNHERRLIYFVIGLASLHAVGLFVGTYFHFADFIHDRYFFDPQPVPSTEVIRG